MSWVKRRATNAVLSRALGHDGDLSHVRVVPKALRWPLQREGVDPVARMSEVRIEQPVSPLAHFFGRTVWLVTGYPESRAFLADTKSFSNDIRPLIPSAKTGPEHSIGGLGFTDPPEHTRLRQILTPEFTAVRLERLRPRIAEIIERQLDVVEAAGPEADLVRDFALPVPFAVITELLGLDDHDREELWRIGEARFDVTAGGIGAFGAASESRSFLLEAARAQRAAPGDGLIGSIITELGDEVDDEALSGLADGVLLGGYETTASTIALGTLVLLQSPEGMASMRDGDAVPDLVEELLRYLSVVQVSFPRFARDDLELFGQPIAKGDVVLCSLSGANRDDKLGAGMAAFDPRRKPVSHLAFGHGFHRCVGAELARMELRAAFPALLNRFPGLSLAVPADQLTYRKLSLVYGVERLPVRLR